ncbi:unnamed protein product [Adineta steineri]|uniref:Uncharacterized protein n=1 Tax=Adineta steineri TaxID=433720 RepID=A0A813V5L0_9BILA|nr:unnamed protein product [Adineta steineri]CAF3694213.1 unnamed protein product [Adineta steineri]
MNETTVTMEHSDSKFFSQRAKHISLLNEQTSAIFVAPQSSPKEVRFQFSNRTYIPITETQSNPVEQDHGNTISIDYHKSMNTDRGRTTIPLSSFILQKDSQLPTPTPTTNTITTPIFVMHDEVQFVRPYFGPPCNNNMQTSSLTSLKRQVLLSALKEIESGLKAL